MYELDESKSLKEMVDDFEIKIIESIKKCGSLKSAKIKGHHLHYHENWPYMKIETNKCLNIKTPVFEY